MKRENIGKINNPNDHDVYECDICGTCKVMDKNQDAYFYTCENKCFEGKKSWHEPFIEKGIKYNYFHFHEELEDLT